MAILQIDIPDEHLVRVRDAICTQYAYQATIQDPNDPSKLISNPQSRLQFVRMIIARFIKDSVRAAAADQAAQTARTAALAEMDKIAIS